jgi:branched-chain amino acid aminotransferase
MEKIFFMNGEFLSESEAKVSVLTHSFNYGTGAFEGIRAFWDKKREQLFVFALTQHLKRFQNSCKILHLSLSYSLEELTKIVLDVLKFNKFREDVYIRPLAYIKSERIGVKLVELESGITIFAIPFGSYYPDEESVRAMVSSWRRISDNAIPARAKCCGAYVNSALAKSEALLAGVDEAIVLNEDGHVAEASAANIFIVRDGIAITPPVTANILEGITRNIAISLLQNELGIDVQERDIDRSELYIADEIFVTGTACNISAIVEVDKIKIGGGKIGEITKNLRELYFEIVHNENPAYSYLLTPVY